MKKFEKHGSKASIAAIYIEHSTNTFTTFQVEKLASTKEENWESEMCIWDPRNCLWPIWEDVNG